MRRSILFLPLLALAGALYQRWAAVRDEERFPAPGRLVDVGGRRLHLQCEGQGTPTVILESGMPGVPLGWSLIQAEVAKFTRVCSYDRGGIGWSDPGLPPRTARQIVHELHNLLNNAGIEGPYILVGGSFGGHYVRLFAHHYPEKVAGLVLVDPSHEDMVARFPPAMQRMFPMTKLFAGLFSLLASVGVVRLAVERLPFWDLLFQTEMPDELRQQLKMHFSRREQWQGAYAEASVFEESEAEVRAARARQPSFGELPLTLLTASGTWDNARFLPPGVRPGEITPLWLELHRDLASLSSNSKHIVLDDLSHTEVMGAAGIAPVVGAIREMVEAVRQAS